MPTLKRRRKHRGAASQSPTVLGIVALAGLVMFGMRRLDQRVTAGAGFDPPVSLALVNTPDWLEQEGWAPRILSSVELKDTDRWSDPILCARIAEQFRQSGWVRRVVRVVKKRNGVVEIECEFRRPIAMVRTGLGYVPVDTAGVRLPEIYDRLTPGWPMIVGVESPVPDVGQAWTGSDARAGIRLAEMLFDEPYAARIASINVGNYAGRENSGQRHIQIILTSGTHIRWGSAPGEEIEEPTAAQKLINLRSALENRTNFPAWLDVSIFDHAVVEPKPAKNAPLQTARSSPDHWIGRR